MGVLSICGDNRSFYYFEQLCGIPHGSGNTKAISDWIVAFAVSHNLRYVQDSMNSVIIYKDATPGYESAQPIILQGHIDMVCVHTDDYDIDMTKTPVKVCTDGKMIWADRTSLGGDNGVAVAVMMAILERDDLEHPSIECVFTSDEETGMYGAKALDYSLLKAKKVINLDCCPEGVCTVTCAGGVQVNSYLPVSFAKESNSLVKVSIDGLLGGHSGNMAGQGRGNANLILFQTLVFIFKGVAFGLCSANGGKGENVIPSSASAVISIEPNDLEIVKLLASQYAEVLKDKFKDSEPSITISVEKIPDCTETKCMTVSDTNSFIYSMSGLPNDLQAWDENFSDLPKTSLSMGIVKTHSDSIEYHHYIRSSVDAEKQALVDFLRKKACAFGGRIETFGEYSGWKYNPQSPLRDLYNKTYFDLFNIQPTEKKTHSGLECGTFYANIPDVDIIAISANQIEIHSVDEKLDVQSTIRLYELLVEMLKRSK